MNFSLNTDFIGMAYIEICEVNELVETDSEHSVDYEIVHLSDNDSLEPAESKIPKSYVNISLEKSKEDAEEAVAVSRLFGDATNETSQCCRGRCNKVIPQEIALAHRRSFQEMNKKEQDLVILSQLLAHRRSLQLQQCYGKKTRRKKSQNKKSNDIQRHDVQYYFYGLKICKKMFLWLYDLGTARLLNLCKHVDKHGLSVRVHGLKNRPAMRQTRILKPTDIENIVTFIKNLAKQLGTPVQGRLSKFRNNDVVRLPTEVTKKEVYKKYCDYAECQPAVKKIAISTFNGIWMKYCPYITEARSADILRKIKKVQKPSRLYDSESDFRETNHY